tara:strand:+ start:779 stop:1183 length:405 start_codon:yes stop_codon:yes gene_type:complete
MSTLSTANIESKAANTPPVIKDLNGTECGQFCRAWVNFDGSIGAVSVRGSFNVSSVTENASGDYTINFTTAMSNANYAVTTLGHTKLTNNGDQRVLGFDEGNTYSTTAVQITNRYYTGAGFSGCTHASVVVFGD